MRRLYAIQSGEGPIKLGISNNPTTRLAQLQTATYDDLYLLATTPGTEQDERNLHELFNQSRLRGEWFKDSPSLRQVLSTWEKPPAGEFHDEWSSITSFLAQSQQSRTEMFLAWFGDAWDGTEVQSDVVRAFVDTASADEFHSYGDRLLSPNGDPFVLLKNGYMRTLHLLEDPNIVARLVATFEGARPAEVVFVRRTPTEALTGTTLRLVVHARNRRRILQKMQTARQFLSAVVPGP